MSDTAAADLNDDLIWGTQAIADFIGISLSECQYLIRQKELPIGRMGKKTLFASKKKLLKHFQDRVREARKTA
jgi:hypothetical protein